MGRYAISHNRHLGTTLFETDDLREACWFLCRNRVTPTPAWLYGDGGRHRDTEAPPILVPDFGTVETRWYAESVPGKPRNSHVLLRDGTPMMMGDEEVIALADRWWDEVLWPSRLARRRGARRGRRAPATRRRMRGIARRRTTMLDAAARAGDGDGDGRGRGVPGMRPGARVPDAWDPEDGPARASKCWKDQSRRRRQWRPIDMPPQPPRDDGDAADGADAPPVA